MKALASAPNLVEQVRDAILNEIAAGKLAPGDRIIQEQIAQALGQRAVPGKAGQPPKTVPPVASLPLFGE